MVRMTRNTMGQDWGGRRADNPKDAPKITGDQIRARAAELGLEVKREDPGWSMWMVRQPGQSWFTLGTTNYVALGSLQSIADGEWPSIKPGPPLSVPPQSE